MSHIYFSFSQPPYKKTLKITVKTNDKRRCIACLISSNTIILPLFSTSFCSHLWLTSSNRILVFICNRLKNYGFSDCLTSKKWRFYEKMTVIFRGHRQICIANNIYSLKKILKNPKKLKLVKKNSKKLKSIGGVIESPPFRRN